MTSGIEIQSDIIARRDDRERGSHVRGIYVRGMGKRF